MSVRQSLARRINTTVIAAVLVVIPAAPVAAQQQMPKQISTSDLAVTAMPLVAAFQAARQYDPQFRGALAERNLNESAVLQSRLSYAPQLSSSYQQLETENKPRATVAVTQPLLSGDRYFALKEATPRSIFAESTLAQREQDLVTRLLKAVTELVRARAAVRANEHRISLLDEQAKRAQRIYELGEGTITDKSDTLVRREQARAQQFSLVARVRVAESQFEAIVGAKPPAGIFEIVDMPRPIKLESLERYLMAGQDTNPQVVALRQSEIIADLGIKRARSAFLPAVYGVAQQTESGGRSTSYLGFSVSFPLQGQSYVQLISSRAQAERAIEQRRDAEQRVKVDIERLRELVDSGQQEFAVRKDAIAAAELAVQANLKSQQGGIRTTVDVLNAVQALADVSNEYAATAATLAENYLSLLLQSSYDSAEALQRVQTTLFKR